MKVYMLGFNSVVKCHLLYLCHTLNKRGFPLVSLNSIRGLVYISYVRGCMLHLTNFVETNCNACFHVGHF